MPRQPCVRADRSRGSRAPAPVGDGVAPLGDPAVVDQHGDRPSDARRTAAALCAGEPARKASKVVDHAALLERILGRQEEERPREIATDSRAGVATQRNICQRTCKREQPVNLTEALTDEPLVVPVAPTSNAGTLCRQCGASWKWPAPHQQSPQMATSPRACLARRPGVSLWPLAVAPVLVSATDCAPCRTRG